MNNRKKNNRKNMAMAATQKSATPDKGTKHPWGMLKPCTARWLTYALGFVALLAFVTWGYGDVFERAEQNSFVTTDSEQMHYLLSQPMGQVYWFTRWVLILFKWSWLGGIVLAAIYTLTARFTDYALQLPRKFEGLGFIVPIAELAWVIWRGTNVYYQTEPSKFVLVALSALAVTAVLALVSWVITRNREHKAVPAGVRPWGLCVALVLNFGELAIARTVNENVILTARFKNLELRQDWDTIIEEAKAAKRPTRAVAAYYAIALEETDQLLQGMYDIPYDFPVENLDSINGTNEYGIFTADCNYHAGLLNAAYRLALEHTVMNGPRLDCYKRLAVCALLMNEKALARKYLSLVGQMPFEGDFVQKYTAMLNNKELIKEDAELMHVLSLEPKMDDFEQNYRQPLFLGYNFGLTEGTDATLVTSAAACLYGKDLQSFLPRAQVMAQKGMSFPPCMQQAICILALRDQSLLKHFPQVNQYVMSEISSFLTDARPYAKDRLKLRSELKEQWLGTYVYYYYTENNDPDQVIKADNLSGNKGYKNSVN